MLWRAPVVVLLLLAIALAGCLGGEDPEPAEGNDEPRGAEVTETTGAIEGEVLDGRSLDPVRDATVGVLKSGDVVAQTTSDAQGKYAVSGLEPGTYQVSMSALGFRTMARAAEVKAGEIIRVAALLEPLPREAPYSELFPFEGFMSFGTHNPGFAMTSGLEDENHAVQFEFEVDPRLLETVIAQAFWDNPSVGLRGNLWLNPNCDPVCAPDQEYAEGEGFGEFTLRADHSGGGWAGLEGETATLTLQIWAERGEEPLTVAFQQNFRLYVGAFYVQPAAEGHVVNPEA